MAKSVASKPRASRAAKSIFSSAALGRAAETVINANMAADYRNTRRRHNQFQHMLDAYVRRTEDIDEMLAIEACEEFGVEITEGDADIFSTTEGLADLLRDL
eukprot:7424667-Karenia_brevis.AAC.1